MSTVEGGQVRSAPRIVVGVDGSGPSVLALKWAASYAEAVGATVDAVSAWHTSSEWGFAGVPLNWDPKEVAGNVLDAAIIEAFGRDAPPG